MFAGGSFGSEGCESKQRCQTHTTTSLSSSGGTLSHSQINEYSPASPGSALEPPLSTTCPKHSAQEASRKYPSQMPEPPHVAVFYSESLSNNKATHSSLRQSPVTLQRKQISFACILCLILSVTTQRSCPQVTVGMQINQRFYALSLPGQASTASTSLRTRPQSVCQSHAPLSPYL